MTHVTLMQNSTVRPPALYMAFDLSNKSWKIAFSDGRHYRQCAIEGKNLEALAVAIYKARQKFRLEKGVRIISCFEAGRDGFWLDRYLHSIGVDNLAVNSSRIEISRGKRRARKVGSKRSVIRPIFLLPRQAAPGPAPAGFCSKTAKPRRHLKYIA